MTVLEDIDLADGLYEGDVEWSGMIRNPLTSLTASAIPVRPPSAWFTNPGFATLEPLTVTADGQIRGHIASWREDHIGMSGRVKAPRSKSGYAFFATGSLETAEGGLVNVGQITLTGGHAPLEASVAEAVAHYDNTQSAFADVAVGEDKHGIWVAGALRPTVDDNALRSIRASSVSGDWRPINGSLEMVAVCAVNVPGFPIPRARVASGVPIALVAAGTGELVDLMLHQDAAGVAIASAAFDDRLRFVENVVLGRIGDSRQALTAAVEAARVAYDDSSWVSDDDLEPRLAALRASVHGAAPAAPVIDELAALRARAHPAPAPAESAGDPLAALRSRVHGEPATSEVDDVWDVDGMAIDLDLHECVQASLRARVKGGLVARATKSWTADERKKAADHGAAMPGGRFPISDKRDVAKAVHAVGRAKGDKAAVRRHIKKRAKALGAMSSIPDDWK